MADLEGEILTLDEVAAYLKAGKRTSAVMEASSAKSLYEGALAGDYG